MTIIDTLYGPVDQAALKRLRGSFVTADLLKAVDSVDASDDLSEARRLRARALLLRLHGMAQALVNGYGGGMTPPDAPIWDLAEDAADELRGGAADFTREAALRHRLAALRPRDVGDDDAPQPAPDDGEAVEEAFFRAGFTVLSRDGADYELELPGQTILDGDGDAAPAQFWATVRQSDRVVWIALEHVTIGNPLGDVTADDLDEAARAAWARITAWLTFEQRRED
jgi:hypothetical protein